METVDGQNNFPQNSWNYIRFFQVSLTKAFLFFFNFLIIFPSIPLNQRHTSKPTHTLFMDEKNMNEKTCWKISNTNLLVNIQPELRTIFFKFKLKTMEKIRDMSILSRMVIIDDGEPTISRGHGLQILWIEGNNRN